MTTSQPPDLTGYAALFGESLSSKVDLLGRLIGGAHYPSLGQYKERLLADAIRGFLPRTVEVGTGFVMFPHADTNPPGGTEFHDPLNQSTYSISRQCDVLVYDNVRYPTIFRDGDFVVIRPEAVRAVIEVKGSLTKRATLDALNSFHDFGTKWRRTQLFYQEQHVPLTRAPGLFVMAWGIATNKVGRPQTTPSAIRETIAKFYADNVKMADVDGYPFLRQLLIHNEAQIIAAFRIEQAGQGYTDHFGWASLDGRFIRISRDGTLSRDRDRTIAALLAALHLTIAEEDFNRFFSYQDEVRNRNAVPYRYAGMSLAWSDLNSSESRRIIGKFIVREGAD